MAIEDLNGPVTNYTYRPEQIDPHREAIASQRIYVIETDSTESTFPHTPDPHGHRGQRILRAIADRRFAEEQP